MAEEGFNLAVPISSYISRPSTEAVVSLTILSDSQNNNFQEPTTAQHLFSLSEGFKPVKTLSPQLSERISPTDYLERLTELNEICRKYGPNSVLTWSLISISAGCIAMAFYILFATSFAYSFLVAASLFLVTPLLGLRYAYYEKQMEAIVLSKLKEKCIDLNNLDRKSKGISWEYRESPRKRRKDRNKGNNPIGTIVIDKFIDLKVLPIVSE